MNTVLWIAQAALALKFLTVGYSHGIHPNREKMAPGIERLGAWGRPVMILTGLLSFAGAAGLIVPHLTAVPPGITILSAVLLALLGLSSILLHSACREKSGVAAGVVIFALCAFVAYGRWALSPF